MKVGSLFSGIGGFDLGLERAGFTIEWQVENNDYCREVLKKHWPAVPCHYDITTIDWEYIPKVDLVCGGFPCQPFSCAGKQQGKDDDRYLWPEVVRCLTVLRPTWFLGENVYGLLHLGIEQVCADLEALGYSVAVLGIPACAVDAPHIRKRVWIIAHTERDSLRLQPGGSEPGWAGADESRHDGTYRNMADTECSERRTVGQACNDHGTDGYAQREESAARLRGRREDVADTDGCDEHGRNSHVQMGRAGSQKKATRDDDAARAEWSPEPDVGRVAHGIPARVDRLRGLGNAIVPQIAEALGRMILEAA